MKATENRKNKEGQLVGHKPIDKWQAWRRARNNAIENPRRLKTCKDDDKQHDDSNCTPEVTK